MLTLQPKGNYYEVRTSKETNKTRSHAHTRKTEQGNVYYLNSDHLIGANTPTILQSERIYAYINLEHN
jgi:hypothetical protein